jgi:hypothetical protein
MQDVNRKTMWHQNLWLPIQPPPPIKIGRDAAPRFAVSVTRFCRTPRFPTLTFRLPLNDCAFGRDGPVSAYGTYGADFRILPASLCH